MENPNWHMKDISIVMKPFRWGSGFLIFTHTSTHRFVSSREEIMCQAKIWLVPRAAWSYHGEANVFSLSSRS